MRILGLFCLLAFYSAESKALTLQIPTRPTLFPLEIETNSGPGSVSAWGDNTYGQTNVPAGLSNVVQVSVGQSHTLALKNNGTVVAWGDNTYGQTNVPYGLTNVVQVAAGMGFSYALKNDGTVVAWGDNTHGQLLGAPYASNVVGIQIPPDSYQTTYLYASGAVLGPPSANIIGLTNVVQISKGLLFLEANGSVIATGDNIYGQTNIPTGLTDAVEVDAGFGFNVALKNNGTVVAWGDNTYGQTNVPYGLTNVIQVSALSYYSIFALKNNGTVVAWGDNTYGQTNVPYGLTNVIDISAGTTSVAVIGGPFVQIIYPLGPISNQVVGVPLFLNPTSSSGLPVALSIKSGPATVSGNTITPTGVGTVVLAADQAGNANYNPAPQVTTSFTVKNFNQGIANFKTIPSKNYPCAPFAVTRPKATSGLPVTLSVISGPATVTGNMVRVTTAGVVVLAANQGGNSQYNPAPQVTTSFSVATKTSTQTIKPFKRIPNKTYGTPFTITLPKASSGLPVAVTVQSGNATINGNTVTPTGTGYVTLAANQVGNQYFNPAAKVTTTFFVR
jgi:hypothetical protein